MGENREFEPDKDQLINVLHLVDVESAEATVPSDRERILRAVHDGVGAVALNNSVRAAINGAVSAALNMPEMPRMACALACGDDGLLKEVVGAPEKWRRAMLTAAAGGHVAILTALLDARADPHAPIEDSPSGITPLHAAARAGGPEVVRVLVERKGDPNIADKDGHTALFLAAQHDQVESATVLLHAKAEMNVPETTKSHTPLMIAARGGNMSVLELLLEHDSTGIDLSDSSSWTALTFAANTGQTAAASILIEQGACVDGDGKEPPLCKAASAGHITTAKELLNARADPNRADSVCFAPLALACCQPGAMELPRLLLEASADIHPANEFLALGSAASVGNDSLLELLLDAKADAAQCDGHGWSSVMHAANGGHAISVDLLLRAGASIESQLPDGRTILVCAILSGNLATVDCILKAKADPQFKDPNGWCLVGIAASTGNVPILKSLLAFNAPSDVANNDGYTPLQIAEMCGQPVAAEVLRGASPQS